MTTTQIPQFVQNPRSGEFLTTELSFNDASEILKQIQNKTSFVADIYAASQSSRGMSEGQKFWFYKLAEQNRADKPAVAPVADFAKVKAIFDSAKRFLKNPKITFNQNNQKIVLSPAKEASRNPGSIYLKINGEYMGKISPEGVFAPLSHCPQEATQYLREFAENPAGMAAGYGRETGECCFCARHLTDERSVKVGYGVICAGHYSLPWGD